MQQPNLNHHNNPIHHPNIHINHIKEAPQHPQPTQPTQIKSPESVLPLIKRWQKRKQENFLTITLNGAHEVIKIHHVSKGLVNRTIVHPRECFYPSIRDLATAVIFVHNHPSGSTVSSPEDDDITKRLSMAAEILGINMLDHIIITPTGNFYSYSQAGKIPYQHNYNELEEFVQSLSLGKAYGHY
jgi:DNA repair protein RadC